MWTFEWFAAGGGYYIKNKMNGKCLEVGGKATNAGAPVQEWDCTYDPYWSNQVWTAVQNGGGGGFTLRAKHTGFCLDSWGSGTANGTILAQWPCTGNTNHSFWLDYSSYGQNYGDQPDSIPPPPNAQSVPPRFGGSVLNRAGVVSFADSTALVASIPSPYRRIASALSNNDCTNFASTVWHIGGALPQTNEWYRRLAGFGIDNSNQFTFVVEFVNYWLASGRVSIAPMDATNGWNTAKPGDIIVWKLHGSLTFNHIGIEVGWTGSVSTYYDTYGAQSYNYVGDQVDQHGSDRKRAPWNFAYLQAIRQGVANDNVPYLLHWID
jgi:Ricin-type beta-trefoil lectin domain-like/Putative amidase domain